MLQSSMTPTQTKQRATISSSMIAKIIERLSDGKRVRRTLPLGGRLHIDRTLPFMIVNRTSPEDIDQSTHRLVRGEASEAEILLRLQELRTSYSIEGEFSITYTFGSIYNNIVNPRFGNGRRRF